MQHNHNPDATWETTLVIPEAVKSVEEQLLDALLRIEALLQAIIEGGTPRAVVEPEPTMSQFVSKEDLEAYKEATATKAKGRRK